MSIRTVLYIELNQELRGMEHELVNTLFNINESGNRNVKNPIDRELFSKEVILEDEDIYDIERFEVLETDGLYIDSFGSYLTNPNDPLVIHNYKSKVIQSIEDEIRVFEGGPERKAFSRYVKNKRASIEYVNSLTAISCFPASTTISVTFEGEVTVSIVSSVKEVIAILSEDYEGLSLRRLYSDRIESKRLNYSI